MSYQSIDEIIPGSTLMHARSIIDGKFDNCDFSYAAIVLSLLYFFTLAQTSRYFISILSTYEKNDNKNIQRVFLAVLLLSCALRITFFLGWLFDVEECSPKIIELNQKWVHYLSNVPGTLYLSAYSLLVYRFAQLFHLKLHESRIHTYFMRVVMGIVVILNISMYGLFVTSSIFSLYKSSNTTAQRYYITVLSISAIFVASLFLAYGIALYWQVENHLRIDNPEDDGIANPTLDFQGDYSVYDQDEQYLNNHNGYMPGLGLTHIHGYNSVYEGYDAYGSKRMSSESHVDHQQQQQQHNQQHQHQHRGSMSNSPRRDFHSQRGTSDSGHQISPSHTSLVSSSSNLSTLSSSSTTSLQKHLEPAPQTSSNTNTSSSRVPQSQNQNTLHRVVSTTIDKTGTSRTSLSVNVNGDVETEHSEAASFNSTSGNQVHSSLALHQHIGNGPVSVVSPTSMSHGSALHSDDFLPLSSSNQQTLDITSENNDAQLQTQGQTQGQGQGQGQSQSQSQSQNQNQNQNQGPNRTGGDMNAVVSTHVPLVRSDSSGDVAKSQVSDGSSNGSQLSHTTSNRVSDSSSSSTTGISLTSQSSRYDGYSKSTSSVALTTRHNTNYDSPSLKPSNGNLKLNQTLGGTPRGSVTSYDTTTTGNGNGTSSNNNLSLPSRTPKSVGKLRREKYVGGMKTLPRTTTGLGKSSQTQSQSQSQSQTHAQMSINNDQPLSNTNNLNKPSQVNRSVSFANDPPLLDLNNSNNNGALTKKHDLTTYQSQNDDYSSARTSASLNSFHDVVSPFPSYPTVNGDVDHHDLSIGPMSDSNPPPKTPKRANPLLKLLFISLMCGACMLLRSILLMLLRYCYDGSDQGAELTVVYFSLSEIVPALFMLMIFNMPSNVVSTQHEIYEENQENLLQSQDTINNQYPPSHEVGSNQFFDDPSSLTYESTTTTQSNTTYSADTYFRME